MQIIYLAADKKEASLHFLLKKYCKTKEKTMITSIRPLSDVFKASMDIFHEFKTFKDALKGSRTALCVNETFA